ncbi:MAG: sugar porter family MFS transporter [Bacteroidetes bacterium]|nr:sugar porter family MFS transporter [Bacteroidota bacterium]
MKIYTLIISLAAAFGGLLFGFDTAVISGVLPYLSAHFNLDVAAQGWAVSCVIIGCIIGTQLAGIPAEKWGRKPGLLITAVLFIITSLGTAFSQSFTAFIVYRIIGGIAIGAASALSPMYIAEVAPAAYRGRLVSLNQLTIVIGILIAFFSNYLIAKYADNSWRLMLGMQLFPAALFLLFLFFIPESPRWLLRHNKVEKAKAIILNLTGQTNLPVIQAEHSNFRQQLKALSTPPQRCLLIVGIVIALLQQFTGINVIMYYAPVIFQKTGINASDALFQTICIGIINLVFTFIAMFVIDSLGRKPLLKTGSLAMAVFLILLAGTYFFTMFQGYWVLIFILGFIASFAMSWGPATWVLIAEIYPNHLRGTAVSIATLFLWIGGFIVSYTFPWILEHLNGTYTFLIYAAVNIAGFVFTSIYVPETSGKSLEELETILVVH